MTNFTKILHIGKGDDGDVFCRVKFTNGKLSITGVEGPRMGGNCKGACGQIVGHDWGISDHAAGWDADTVQRFRDVWIRWHLNDMRPGSPMQMDHICDLEAKGRGFTYESEFRSHYEWACHVLDAAGLNPDGARYGSKWWHEDVPEDVVAFLKSLPDATKTPAWV